MSEIQADELSNGGRAQPESVLRAIVVCDIVDSTALIEQLGDRKGAEFIQQLDRFARDLLQRHRGQEIDKTDGFLLLFDRPIQAVAFALDYQRLLRELGDLEFLPLKARIGIHVGDVLLWENNLEDVARGAKPTEVEGLAKPVAARLMHLALPGQILLSGVAQSLVARSQSELGTNRSIEWQEHGRYRFKGVYDPIVVFEVGEREIAPLTPPAQNGKAYRDIPWWRRRTTIAIEALGLVAIVATFVYFSLRSPDAIAFSKRDWIVVGDFVNQTDESILNDSLQTAFRIGLEQSKYVNVVSDLKVRSTLELMQRDADNTRIDRNIGSELAIRDGARALVLPTVAEIGGRVRVTAEVIDPSSRATVYTESAEGVGFSSVLPSLDKVGQQLRVRLGEAVASVKADGASLPQVTTSNLDALRAYALALNAFADSKDADALELFRHAVKLDPNFALAYMGLARVYEGFDDSTTAKIYVDRAMTLRDRLPARDQLYLDAWAARFGPPGPMLDKWKLLAKLYPDYYAASNNYAFYSWQLENRASDGIEAIQPALSTFDPFRASAYYTLGYMLAAENRFDEAMKSFAISRSISVRDGSFYALTFAAQRQFGEASRILNAMKPSGFATSDIFIPRDRAAVEVDQGNWDRAMAITSGQVSEATKVGPTYGTAFRAMTANLADYLQPKEERLPVLRALVADTRDALNKPLEASTVDAVFVMLDAAYLTQRAGDMTLAQTIIDAAEPKLRGAGYVNLDNMLSILVAQSAIAAGKPKDAVARLEKMRNGTELYLTHVALADAYAADQRFEDSLREAQWLANHRGRAYLELNSLEMLKMRNVAESDLALLREAELNAELGNSADARKRLDAFLAIWPAQRQPATIAARTEKVSAALKITTPN